MLDFEFPRVDDGPLDIIERHFELGKKMRGDEYDCIMADLKILNGLYIDDDTDVCVFWCPGFFKDSSNLSSFHKCVSNHHGSITYITEMCFLESPFDNTCRCLTVGGD